MTRKYTKKKRAEAQAETHRRIAQAALDLHRIHGPGRTTISMVAEQAGVQRHTLYAHFPDEKSLFLACSALHLAEDPPPESAAWIEIGNRKARLEAGLGAIYAWFARNDGLIAAVMRDAEYHPLTREISQHHFGPRFMAWAASLSAEGDTGEARAMVALALSFHSWRTLVRDGGLSSDAAARLMAANILKAGG